MNFLLAQAASDGGTAWRKFWLGKTLNASPEATQTEWLYMFILWVNIISFVVVMGMMFYFVVKYRRSAQKTNYQVSIAHNTPLELAWSIIPLMVMVPIFWWGFKGYVGKLASPTDSEEIMVRGQRWDWSITYRTGATPQAVDEWALRAVTKSGKLSPVFAVPAGRPVRFILNSSDVIHAFFIPDFRTKIDVTPNRYTSMWFMPAPLDPNDPQDAHKQPDGSVKLYREHTVFCAEYCGDDHSEMAAVLRVVPADEYEVLIRKWTAPPDTTPLWKIGEIIFNKTCATCHTLDGRASTGPTWRNMYGHEVELTSGQHAQVDENYIRESILNPGAKIVKGFQPNMPSFQGQLKPLEVDALIMFIKRQSDKATQAEKDAGDKTPAQLKDEAKNKS